MKFRNRVTEKPTGKPDANTELHDLAIIARKLSMISSELYRLTGKDASVDSLLNIAYEPFRKEQTIRKTVEDLVGPDWIKEGTKAWPKVEGQNLLAYRRTLTAILTMGRLLAFYSEKRCRRLVAGNLQVKDGEVVFSKRVKRELNN